MVTVLRARQVARGAGASFAVWPYGNGRQSKMAT
jgi:hypothetical protein